MKDFEVLIRDGLLTVNSTTSVEKPSLRLWWPEIPDRIEEPDDRYRSIDIDHCDIVVGWFSIKGLSVIEKKIIALRLGGGKGVMPYRAIAEKVGGSREIVRQRYIRGIELMEQLVKRRADYDAERAAIIVELARVTEFF